MSNDLTKKIFDNSLPGLMVVFLLFTTSLMIVSNQRTKVLRSYTNDSINSIAVEKINSTPVIYADSALVWDKKNNLFIYENNSDQSMPIASITKVLTAIASLEYLPKESEIKISINDLATEGTSGLITDETWKMEDLVVFTLMTSSNDGAAALGRTVTEVTGKSISKSFNDLSRKLNLNNYSWENTTGLDTIDGVSASNSASAQDVIKIIDYLLTTYPDIALETGLEFKTFKTNLKTHQANTTNNLASTIPHTLSAKTGFTIVAGGNLVIVTDIGPARPVYVVVLGSTINERFSDTEKLYNYTINQINNFAI